MFCHMLPSKDQAFVHKERHGNGVPEAKPTGNLGVWGWDPGAASSHHNIPEIPGHGWVAVTRSVCVSRVTLRQRQDISAKIYSKVSKWHWTFVCINVMGLKWSFYNHSKHQFILLYVYIPQHSVHCGSIRQTATILSMNRDCLRTGDKASVHFRFIKTPEYLHCDQRLVFREGRTKAVGTITKVGKPSGSWRFMLS